MNNKRGQVSTEALFVIGAIFLIFMGIAVFRMEKMREITFLKQDIVAKNACLEISDALVQAFLSTGSARMKTDYSFSVYRQVITVMPRNITCVITSNVVSSANITKGFFRAERQGETLVLTNI